MGGRADARGPRGRPSRVTGDARVIAGSTCAGEVLADAPAWHQDARPRAPGAIRVLLPWRKDARGERIRLDVSVVLR